MSNEYLFVLDALRNDHLQYMEWLNGNKTQSAYIAEYSVSEGFCERIEIFTGLKPDKLGFNTAFTLEKNDEYFYPYRWLPKQLIPFLKIFEKTKVTQKIMRRLLWEFSKIFSSHPFYPQRIPIEILPFVGITEDSFDFEELSIKNKNSLIQKLKKKGYEMHWDLFTSMTNNKEKKDEAKYNEAIRLSQLSNKFIPIYLGSPDKYGHEFGPHSDELINELKKLDVQCKRTVIEIQKIQPDARFTFMGDHGMDMVHETIDINQILQDFTVSLDIKFFEDFDFFLDSTMLRIWWKGRSKLGEKFIERIANDLTLRDKGYFSFPKESNNRDCDLMWWCKKGVLIEPDFFHNGKKTLKGMHGYKKIDNPSQGFIIRFSKDKRMTQVNAKSIEDLI